MRRGAVAVLALGIVLTVSQSASASSAVNVVDDAYRPGHLDIGLGDTVTWNLKASNQHDHSVTDNSGMGLFDSGVLGPAATWSFRFSWGGTYLIHCTVHPAMTMRVSVPPWATPPTGTLDTTFQIQWAVDVHPPGATFDVQYLFPGTTAWTHWHMDTGDLANAFHPNHGLGTYEFRSRVQLGARGAHTRWSPPVAVAVTE
jgi:plastocyanin